MTYNNPFYPVLDVDMLGLQLKCHTIQSQICTTFSAGTAAFWHDLPLSA